MIRATVGCGLMAALGIACWAPNIGQGQPQSDSPLVAGGKRFQSGQASVRLLAVGDINLGRSVGQQLLQGDTLHPFVAVHDSFAAYDIVFGNLESVLSDQQGETESRRSNLIFTGPPVGARTLQRAGISVVSTANNHALDYGYHAHRETMQWLTEAGVFFAGTSASPATLFDPLIISRNGLRIAFFACTDVMNMQYPLWRDYVATADTSRLFPRIRTYRDSVDFIVVSYHGGEEYAETPSRRTRSFAHFTVAAGADLFLGHHPHVPYGIEEVHGRYIVYSLGNFVFVQPQRFWTRYSFALSVRFVRNGSQRRMEGLSCIPVRCGSQPRFIRGEPEAQTITRRIKRLSSRQVAEEISW